MMPNENILADDFARSRAKKPQASIHYTGRSYIFADAATHLQQPGEFESLDLAIRGAHAAGFDVVGVFCTMGGVVNAETQPTETT